MLRQGLYGLTYRAEFDGTTDGDDATAYLRADGNILGSDRRGGIFTGRCRHDAERGVSIVNIQVRVPPAYMLVTGFTADDDGMGTTVDIEGAFADTASSSRATVHVAGRPMDLELTYLGPLPA